MNDVPNTIIIGAAAVFVEAASSSEAAKPTFQVVDQGPRRVSFFTGRANARAEMDIMVDR